MNEGEGGKVTGIRHIVRLREILQRWHNLSLSKKEATGSAISPAMSQRLRSSYIICDSDEESCHSPEPPPDVPKGYLAVYIGPELRRFIIPTSYLSLPVFKALLEKAEEEFGFDHKGALTIPCEIETFKYILQCIEHNPNNLENGGPSNLDD